MLPARAMAGQRAGAQANDGDMVKSATRRACGVDGLGQRPAEIVIGLWRGKARDRRIVVIAQSLGAVNRGAVKQQAGPAIINLRDLVDAEETACGLDRCNAGPPQAGDDKTHDDEPEKAHRPLSLKQHDRGHQRQQHLKRQLQRGRWLKPRDVPGERQRCAEPEPRQRFAQRPARAASQEARRAKQPERDQDRIFIIAVEQPRRQKAREGATDHPAKRRAEIKFCQPPRAGTPRVKFAVAHQRQQREYDEVERNDRQPEHLLAANQAYRQRRHGERNEAHHMAVGDPRPLAKYRDEGEQVNGQRHDPQERRRRDISRQISGDGDNEPGRNRGQRDPLHPLAATRSGLIDDFNLNRDRHRTRRKNADQAQENSQPRKPDGPDRRLRLQRQQRLDDDGIGEQRGK